MDTVQVQRDLKNINDDDDPRGRHDRDNVVLPDEQNVDDGDQYGQDTMIKEQKMYDYEHEDMSPDRNGGEDGDDGNIQGHSAGQMHHHREEDEDPIQEKIAKIIQICKENDALFGDSEFPATDQSLYKDPTNIPDYDQNMPLVEWRRPQEIAPDEAMMIKDGTSPGDVKQGNLGDCWLLGSFLILSTHPDLLRNLIVHDGIEHGFAVFQFFKNGKWQYVIVDTRIPYNQSSKTPLYGHCADPNEFWVPLLEKAYAKLHGCYEAMNGGSMAEALVDLTGGASEKYNLRAPETKENIESGQFWKDLKKYFQAGYLIGCSNSVKDENGKQEDGFGPTGILFNHAYGVLDVRDIDGLQLIRIRNPWGHGEWTGKFADEDEAWDDHKGLKDKLQYVFKDDGTWWMRYEDWCAHYNKMYICKIFPSTWSQFSISGEWKGNTAGGAYPPMIDRDEESKDAKVEQDTNDRWFNNPQYRLSVTKKTQVIISLMQEDEKISKRPYIPVNFLVVRVKSKRERLWEIDKDDVVLEAAEGLQRFGQREITKTTTLYPVHDKKNVHYVIVPNTEDGVNKKDEERPFFLRVFASEHIEVAQLPPTIEQQFQGKWAQNTAGGKRVTETGKENQFWCRNPQYFLNITKPTHLKIILKKKGGRRVRGVPIGITVVKAFPPTNPPAAKIIKPGKDQGGTRMASSIGKTADYALTLKNNNSKEKGENIPKFEPPKLENLERKLQLLPGEWYEETFYKSDDVAALYSFYQATQGPFIIIPSMSKEEVTADFTLTSKFSSNYNYKQNTQNKIILKAKQQNAYFKLLQSLAVSQLKSKNQKIVEMQFYLENGLIRLLVVVICMIKNSNKKLISSHGLTTLNSI